MVKKSYRSPGPKYDAPTTVGYEKMDVRLHRAPAYSLGQLLHQQHTSPRVPGPKYDLSNVTRHGTIKVTGASLASCRPIGRPVPSPGPAAYNIVPCVPLTMTAMPMYSIGMKRDSRKKFTVTPAPNAYGVATSIGNRAPDLPSVPMYTIPGRSVEPGRTVTYGSPGPARYSTVLIDRIKEQTPRPVILGRPHDQLHRGRRTPAPNAYLPGPLARYASAPQFTMAGRFPERVDPYYTAADKVPDWE